MQAINHQNFTSSICLESLNNGSMIIVRDRIVSWLKENHIWIEFYLCNPQKYSVNFDFILKILKKINKIIFNSSYAITGFIRIEGLSRHFPQVDLLPDALDRKPFIRCSSLSNPPQIRSRDEANEIVQFFSSLDFSWDALDECEGRAEVSCRLLKAMGIRDERVKKIWIAHQNRESGFHFFSPSNRIVFWYWHIAPLVITETGEKLVIDLFFDKNRALSLKEWTCLIAKQEPYDAGEIESQYTCNIVKRKKVLVTDDIFALFTKRIHAQYFISRVESDSYTERFLTRILVPYRTELEPISEDANLQTSFFVDERPINNSKVCIIS